MNIGTLTVLMGVNTAGLSRAAVNMRRFEKQIIGSSGRIQFALAAIGSQMALTGAMITQYLTVPLGLLGGFAVKTFADFEAGLAKITGLVGIAADQTRRWGDEMLSMAGKVGQTPKELVQGLYRITSGGIRGAESMEILKNSALAASSGMGELEDIARLTTSAMNAYGKEDLNAATALDTFVAGVREGQLEARDFVSNLGKIFPVAVQLGVGLGDVTASMASLTRTGTSAAEAATQVRRMLVTIIQSTPGAEKTLNKLKVSMNEIAQSKTDVVALGKEFTNIGLSFDKFEKMIRENGLLPALLTLRKAIKDYAEKSGENVKKVFGDVFTRIRALLPVLDMLGPNLKQTMTIFDSINGSVKSFDNLIASASETIKRRWADALAGISTSMVRLGSVLKGVVIKAIENFLNFLNRLIDRFAALTEAQQSNIVKWGAFVIALGPVLMILGQVTVAVRLLFKVLWATFVGNPYVLAILAIIAALYTLEVAVRAIVNSWKHVGDEMQILWNKIMIITLEFFDWFDKLDWSKIFEGAWEATKNFFINYGAFLGKSYSTLWKFIKKSIDIGSKIASGAMKTWVDLMIPDEVDMSKYKTDPLKVRGIDKRSLSEHEKTIEYLKQVNIELAKAMEGSGTPRLGDAFSQVWNSQIEAIKRVLGNGYNDLKDYLNKATGGIFEELDKGFAIGGATGVRRTMKPMPSIPLWDSQTELIPMPHIKNAAKAASELNKVQSIIESTNSKLEANAEVAEQLGSKYNKLGVDVNILQSALSALTAPEMAGFADAEQIQIIIGFLDQYIDKVTETQEKTTIFAGLFRDIFAGMNNVIVNALNSTENTLEAFGKFFADFIKGLIFKLIAATIVAVIFAGALSFLGIGGGLISKSLKGVSGFSDLFDGLFKMTSGIGGLASGGIIPAGYPNDSYPAMLTSGETVIPAHKLPDMQAAQAITVQVDGGIKGEDIHWIVKEIDRKRNNSF